jgi:hypothetical protein
VLAKLDEAEFAVKGAAPGGYLDLAAEAVGSVGVAEHVAMAAAASKYFFSPVRVESLTSPSMTGNQQVT